MEKAGKAQEQTIEASRGPNRGVNFAVLLQPFEFAALGTFLDLFEEFHGLGFIARLTRVVLRDHHLDLYGDDIPFGLNQPGSFDSLTGNLHD